MHVLICRVSSQLAKGSFGPICGGKLDGVPVAVKKLELTRSEEEEMVFLREAFIISQFNHPNIVKVLGVALEGQRVRSVSSSGLGVCGLSEWIACHNRQDQSYNSQSCKCLSLLMQPTISIHGGGSDVEGVAWGVVF